jgi:hypothetical protein
VVPLSMPVDVGVDGVLSLLLPFSFLKLPSS